MSKRNPLFVDSTKIQGDSICSDLEVTGMMLYPDEKAFIRIIERNGATHTVELTQAENLAMKGRTWLRHQSEAELQVLITHSGREIFASRPQTFKATYVLSQAWLPNRLILIKDEIEPLPANIPTEQAILRETLALEKENFFSRDPEEVGALIDRWGL